MFKLEKQLRSTLLENPAIQINKSMMWHLPVISCQVAFKRVKRSKMDILMKMMLLTFEQTEIRRAANLSELLLVEELFIADLLKIMQRMGLIRQEKEIYQLTSKGHEQLKTGMISEDMEEEWTMVSYSPAHDEFWPELTEPLLETNEEMQLFRYANNVIHINTHRVLDVLAEKEKEVDENGYQTVVSEVTRIDQQKVEHLPCLEFQLYNKEQDIFYARVWNTWLNCWDDKLEKQIEEREQIEWRDNLMVLNEVTE